MHPPLFQYLARLPALFLIPALFFILSLALAAGGSFSSKAYADRAQDEAAAAATAAPAPKAPVTPVPKALITPVPDTRAAPPPELLHPPDLTDPAFLTCKETAECTYIVPPCGVPLAVNALHYGAVKMWYEHVRSSYTCADWLKAPSVQGISCRARRCAVALGAADPAATAPQIKDQRYCERDEDCVVVLDACCNKNFVNVESAGRLKSDLAYSQERKRCFYPDRRFVRHLRCEKHQCTAELEVPPELYDPTHHTKDRCQQ